MCIIQEIASTNKGKGHNRSRTESKVDPKVDTHPNKKKAFKLKNPFSSKSKVFTIFISIEAVLPNSGHPRIVAAHGTQ